MPWRCVQITRTVNLDNFRTEPPISAISLPWAPIPPFGQLHLCWMPYYDDEE